MPIKCPGLTRRDNSDNFRLRVKVPVDLLTHYHPKKELTATLGTSNREEACVRGLALRAKIFQGFQDIRAKRDAEVRTSLSEVEMDRLALLLQHSMLKADDQIRVNGQEDWLFDRQGEEQALRLETYKRALARGDMSVVAPVVEDWLWGHGIQLDRASQDFKTLAHRFLKALVTATDKQAQRHQGEVVDTPPDPGPFQAPAKAVPPHGDPLTLGAAVSKYIEDKSLSWAASSKKDIVPDLQDFVEMVGDIPVLDLDRDHMRTYHLTMHHLPKRRSQTAKYKGKTLAQLLALDIPDDEKLGAKTLETTFTNVRCLVNWLEAEGLLDRDRRAKFLNKMLVVNRQASTVKPSAFSDEELRLLFHPDHFKPGSFRASWNFWLPLLGLFTGARLEELSQLHLSDIRQEEGSGVWYLDINAEGDKRVKTTAGSRKVPLHPGLIELGLLERVTTLTKKGEARLFPTLTARASTGKVSGAAGQWFTRHRRKCGVGAADGEKSPKVFHSFRHTLITKGKHLGLDRRKIKELVGHEQGEFADVTGGYEGAFSVQDMLETVVGKLDFGGILDLERLKGSKWVRMS